MNEAVSIYTPGVIGCIEQFTIAEEELRQFVIYTYYNKEEEPLYVGCSKSFYDAHYFNSGRLSFFEEVEYVGFVFLDNEAKMKEAKPYYIRARQPKYGRSKYPKLPYLKGCDVHYDELVVSRTELEQIWNEWLAPDEGEAERIVADHEAEIAAWLPMICSTLRITDRDLSEEEARYAWAWFGLGVDEATVKKAYETTVIRVGKFSFDYMNRLLLKWTGTNTNLHKLRAADRAAAKAKLRLMPPDRLLVDLEEEIFREMMQEVAAEEGRRAIEENERLKADPDFVV